MYCSRRLYKGNSYEFCLPLADTGVTEVYFYTDGEFKVGKEPVICGDTMCFTLAAEDIEAMKDGVLRYTDNGDLDTNTPYVVVTPEGYEAKTLDEIMEEAYQSGFTDGYASGITECHPDYSKMPITFECVDAPGGTAYIVCPPTLYRQLNDGPIVPSEWEIDLEDNLIYIPSIWSVQKGDTMRFWASSATTQSYLFKQGASWWADESNTGKYKIYGNIMSLQYEQDEYQDATEFKYAFYDNIAGVFRGSSGITDASDLVLPLTTLIPQAYYNMFRECVNLTAAPALPATTLADRCYNGMFLGCTSLTEAPELPATTLAYGCYGYMFQETSITEAPYLPATTLAQSCYMAMFAFCTSLTTAPELPVTSLAPSCYHTMFRGCTSLATAPALPATNLVMQCYRGMFSGCTSLETAPELPVTSLAPSCYHTMFKDCTSLNHIKCLATDLGNNNTTAWLQGVSPTGTFETPSTTPWTTGISGIPEGWTRVDVN